MHPTGSMPLPEVCTPQKYAPQGWMHPLRMDAPHPQNTDGQQAGGTHPTAIHTRHKMHHVPINLFSLNVKNLSTITPDVASTNRIELKEDAQKFSFTQLGIVKPVLRVSSWCIKAHMYISALPKKNIKE